MADSAPTLGLALIARDEAANLPHLLASVEGAFDQVALLDIGSTDRTVELFEEWATRENLPLGYRVDSFKGAGRSGTRADGRAGGRFRRTTGTDATGGALAGGWCDDFSAWRNAAEKLLQTDWLADADADDEIVGADRLREIVASASPEMAGCSFTYMYEHDAAGRCTEAFERVRLARRGTSRWAGRVHEGRVFDGPLEGIVVLPGVCRWVHRHNPDGAHLRRNLRIARRWVEDEPENPRALSSLLAEELECGDVTCGIEAMRHYLRLKPVRRAMGSRGLAAAHQALERLRLGDPARTIMLDRILPPPAFWEIKPRNAPS